MKPQAWKTGTFDAIATGSVDGRRIVVKADNYEGQPNILLVRLQGSALPEKAVETTLPYSRNLTIELPPYAVSVIEIVANEVRK
jgi:alpha-N-arabinofuranosidase